MGRTMMLSDGRTVEVTPDSIAALRAHVEELNEHGNRWDFMDAQEDLNVMLTLALEEAEKRIHTLKIGGSDGRE